MVNYDYYGQHPHAGEPTKSADPEDEGRKLTDEELVAGLREHNQAAAEPENEDSDKSAPEPDGPEQELPGG